MKEAFFTHTVEILSMLLVAFLLGILLGYIIWYKWRRMYLDLQAEHERLAAQHRDLEKDHASLRYKVEELEKESTDKGRRIMSLEGDIAVLKGKLEQCQADLANHGHGQGGQRDIALGAAAAVAGSGGGRAATAAPDDLKKVEGIGPKIEQLCNGIGIYTWRQLADTSVETLQKMLDDAGPRYKIAKPNTWPKQAEYAANGEWEKLQEYQDFLIGGVDPS